MRGKKLFSLFSHFFKYKQEQSNANTAGKRNTCLNKTSNWPGVLHLHMAELEIIPGLGLVPRLAEPGRCALRADTLSRERLPMLFFFLPPLRGLYLRRDVVLRHLFAHSQEHTYPAATKITSYGGN